MATSSFSINDLADLSLANIFAFLPADERVRLERVCRKWQKVAKSLAWAEFRKLTPNGRDSALGFSLMLAKYQALIDRCGTHLRELSFAAIGDHIGDQWTLLRNLRHLRFDACVSSVTLCAVADNLTRLQSIHISNIDWTGAAGLRDLLSNNNTSLQALRLPASTSRTLPHLPQISDSRRRGHSLRLLTLPASLRLLHINHDYGNLSFRNQRRIDKLLKLAATCCPQLAMLMLPMHIPLAIISLAKLARFDKLFYLRLCIDTRHAVLFADLLAKIGTQLRALLLGTVDARVLHLVVQHCPLLEHYSFGIDGTEGLLSAIQSLFQLANLRSLSIRCNGRYAFKCTQIWAAINGLNAKGNFEYLHLPREVPLSVKFITNLIQTNPKLRRLTCNIERNQTPAELDKLKTLLQNMERPLELELLGDCPPELKMGKNGRIRVLTYPLPECISQPMLRQLWARAIDSVPDLGDLDD